MSKDTVIHKFTGETITFLEQTSDSLLIEVRLPGGGKGPPLHCHDQFTETFTVLEGELSLTFGGQNFVLLPGETQLVPLYREHTFENRSDDYVRFQVKLTPGVGFKESVFIHYGLMDDGLTNDEGVPRNLFHTIYILYLQNTLIAGKSLKAQRFLFRLLIRIGNLFGVFKKLAHYIPEKDRRVG